MNFLVFLAAAAAAGASASAPPAEPAASKPSSLQAAFNAASELASARKCAEAVPALEALQRDPRVKPGSFPASTISVRKGICLVALDRTDEGEQAIAIGLPALVEAGAGFTNDVSDARKALGDARFAHSDRAGAARYYRRALEGKTGSARLPLLASLSRAMAFDGGEVALGPAREALDLIAATPDMPKPVAASYRTLYARTLLNQGRTDEAYKELKQALSLTGGLTTRTSLDEVSLRGDLAMAAMLMKKRDDARLYLAYTGAGRIGDTSFARAEAMDLPLCGSETGLRPEDVAVVEFGINEDGSIMYARTVYSRGGPQVAAAFEQAVGDWYWRPDAAAAIPQFYRLAARVELRCSNRLGKGPGLWAPVNGRFAAWAGSQLPAEATGSDRTAALATLRRLGEDESGATSPTVRVAALGTLLAVEPYTPPLAADKALALTGKASVPAEVVNWLRMQRVMHVQEKGRGRDQARNRELVALAAEPAFAADPLAADTLLLEAAGTRTTRRDPQSDGWVAQVANDTRLPEAHALRQLGWLALANRSAAAGNVAEAQGYYAKTGLNDEQCALLSLPPAIRRTNVGSGDYPMSAAMMGFEGWVRLEYDINADGSTGNVRPLAAYPPLIFGDAATAIGKDVKYDMSYRPGEAATACSANTNTINFSMK
ncbi:MAG TPA: energy transducer TonB [Novosphingobium sp.]|nr:energy transducer TonB [Novosphingobium sp.]